ncbi:hypothetical protein OS493_031405 [Desmophyllum pertusum]|uniref:Uncharacterized protein n=1 Tax=Desmophyllum pertusum TaxID=174260 RepID=A0A9W9YBS0_9CNID|nr:hypothetical protein OS493_031405 [Desmophyllum pertusum]
MYIDINNSLQYKMSLGLLTLARCRVLCPKCGKVFLRTEEWTGSRKHSPTGRDLDMGLLAKMECPTCKKTFARDKDSNIILKGVGNVFVRCVKKHSTMKLNLRGTETKSMQAIQV